MTYPQYTHNLIIKTSGEVLRNRPFDVDELNFSSGRTSVSDNSVRKTIVVPGFINLHTHLAYSQISLKSQPLFSWLKNLMKEIRHLEEGQAPIYEACLAGAREAMSTGTRFIVDNTSYPEETLRAMLETGLHGIIGIEVFGSDPSQAKKIFAEKIALIKNLELMQSSSRTTAIGLDQGISFTLAPHASYDVSPDLWRLCQNWCRQNQRPLLTHAAESKAEEEWFRDADSIEAEPAKEFWEMLGTLEPKLKSWKKYSGSIDYLHQNQMLSKECLITHMCEASNTDLELIREWGITLVTSPRSNAYLMNAKARTELWDKLGIEYGLGTDSRASNYDLDIRREVNQLKHLSARQRFELITNKATNILNEYFKIPDSYIVLEIIKNDIDLETADPFEIIMNEKMTKVMPHSLSYKVC